MGDRTMNPVRGREDGAGPRRRSISISSTGGVGDNLSVLSDALWTEAGASVRVEALAKRLAGDFDIRVSGCEAI